VTVEVVGLSLGALLVLGSSLVISDSSVGPEVFVLDLFTSSHDNFLTNSIELPVKCCRSWPNLTAGFVGRG
jgi:hypothetical protein